jgi:hypothetical protein
MNEEELKRLIERYYNGDSTEEEEDVLRNYFRQADIPEGYEAEKEIFSFYTESADYIDPSQDFEVRILAGVDSSERKKGLKRIKRYLPLMSAAAGLLILVGSYFFFVNKTESPDTFKDPRIAYAETIKILRDVSVKLNRGSQALEPVGKINEMTLKSIETLNKSTKYVEKNIKNLDLIQRAIEKARVTKINN